MKKLSFAVALFAATLTTVAFAQDHSVHGAMGLASQAYMDAMAKMDTDMKAMKMSGKPGIDFAAMMIPHHQSAIDMAKAYLASDEKDPELTKLSNDIVAAQESEIAFLKAWLKKNGQ